MLRNLVAERQREDRAHAGVPRVARDRPPAVHLLGTSRLARPTSCSATPTSSSASPTPSQLHTLPTTELVERARRPSDGATTSATSQRALARWKSRHLLGIMARDVLHAATSARSAPTSRTSPRPASKRPSQALEPALPFAVIALGRFGGGELSYASDLDVVFVYDGTTPADFEEANRLAIEPRLRSSDGPTPAERIWDVDLDLRPEGKQGAARPRDRGLRHLLRPLGPRVGAPGHGPGASGGRRPDARRPLHGPARRLRLGAPACPTTTCARSAG